MIASGSGILVVDPAPASAAALRDALHGEAEIVHAASLQEGLDHLRATRWRAILLSMDFTGADLALVRRLVASGTDPATMVLTTEHPTMQLMVDASRLGVLGVLSSPPQADELRATLREVFTAEEVVPLGPAEVEADEAEDAVGGSPEMFEVFRMVGRVAPSPATVLILGESGTGKELVARAIHRHSDRSAGPFVAINCAAIPENLLESELFGHEKGAFTGAIARKIGRWERAHGGTLLLDEIGDMSLALQAKILRALQEREIERVGGEQRIPVDVRVVAATHRNLPDAIRSGTFREDLYFRLAVVTLQLPRLRDRGMDLELLTHYFVALHAAHYHRDIRGISRAVFDRLRQHDWPGNIRELRNVTERAVLMARGSVLLLHHLPLEQVRPPSPPAAGAVLLAGYSPELPLADVERLHIREVLQHVAGHMGRASEILGVHRNTLTRKVREYGLDEFASP